VLQHVGGDRGQPAYGGARDQLTAFAAVGGRDDRARAIGLPLAQRSQRHALVEEKLEVFRLVTRTPQRLSLDTLAALCDILDVGVEDLIEISATNTQVPKTAGEAKAAAPPAVRRTTIRRPDGL
jgi:DNA-binding Xre family transcriptional regulator